MRIALTGGSTGIGAETVRQLAAAGHEITLFDIAEPAGSVADWIRLDLADPASIAAAIAAAEGEFDGLCNSAGIPPRGDNAAQCLAINTLGTIAFTRQFLARPASPPKAVVSLASKAGFGWQDNLAQLEALLACPLEALEDWVSAEGLAAPRAYQISKQAIIYWSQLQAAAHLGQTRFVSVSPSAVDTGILDAFLEAFGEQTRTNLERVGRPGKPEEIAALVCFLLSEGAGWMNGVDVIADGGMGAAQLAISRSGG